MARFRQMTIRKNARSESIPIDLTSKLGIIFNQPTAFRHRAHEVTFTLYECIKALPRYDELIPTNAYALQTACPTLLQAKRPAQ